MSVPRHHAPGDAVATGGQGPQVHLEKRRVSRIDMAIPRIHPLPLCILHVQAAKRRFKGAIDHIRTRLGAAVRVAPTFGSL
jgi:hypothetical protein